MKNQGFPDTPKHKLKGHKGPIYVAKFNKDGSYVMSGSGDKSIILWNPIKGTMIKKYEGAHNYEVLDITIVPDNSRFASCGGDKISFIWDVLTGKILRKFTGHAAKINSLAFNYDQNVLATGSYDATLRFWDLRLMDIIYCNKVVKDFKDSISKVIIDGEHIITSCMDGIIKTFDIRKFEVISDNVGAPVSFIQLSRDKKCIAASCLDNKVRLQDRNNAEILSEYGDHKSQHYVVGCDFSWDDSHIIVGSEDGQVYVYDTLKKNAVAKLNNHNSTISYVQFSPKKDSFLSASHDTTITYWSYKTT